MDPVNSSSIERSIGIKYAKLFQSSIRSAISRETGRITGDMLKTTAKSKMDQGELQRIAIQSPKYSFMLHHGFEGVKSNGVKIALRPRGHLFSLKEVNLLNGLADEITAVRGDSVTASIKF